MRSTVVGGQTTTTASPITRGLREVAVKGRFSMTGFGTENVAIEERGEVAVIQIHHLFGG